MKALRIAACLADEHHNALTKIHTVTESLTGGILYRQQDKVMSERP